MNAETLKQLFKKHENEFLEFDKIPKQKRLSTRPDIHAFILLNSIVENSKDMISAAEHDEIFLDIDLEELAAAKITEEQIIDLIRCGVRISEFDSLAMFV